MVVLQGTPYCNLNCSYCDLSAESRQQRHKMPMDMIEKVFRDIFVNTLHSNSLMVVWHSGEPLTLPPDYYQQAIDLIRQLRNELVSESLELTFDFQTNAVLISDQWVEFFKANADDLKLGVSCDGPAHIHDAYRKNWGGKSTHVKVLSGMERLKENQIKFKVIAVVTEATFRDPDGFFDFFLEWSDSLSGFHFNILADGSLSANPDLNYTRDDRKEYYSFYRHMLRLANDAAQSSSGFRIQNFTQALSRIVNEERDDLVAGASQPIRTLNVDAHGHVTTFYAGLDRSAFPNQYGDGIGLSLGQIGQSSLPKMMSSRKIVQIHSDFKRSQDNCRTECHYYGLCPGGFELAQLSEHGEFDGGETTECKIIVKTLVDALLDDIAGQSDYY